MLEGCESRSFQLLCGGSGLAIGTTLEIGLSMPILDISLILSNKTSVSPLKLLILRSTARTYYITAVTMSFHRRRLPHWMPDQAIIFVTWRMAGSPPPPDEPPERFDPVRSGYRTHGSPTCWRTLFCTVKPCGNSALRKNPTAPQVLLGFGETRIRVPRSGESG